MPGSPSGPLSGLRVFDLTRILAGPTCTQILGDLGADIIKIERPGAGDDTRKWGPPFIRDGDGNETKEAAYFQAANRNKRSVTLDLTSGAGQEIARSLIAKSDVLVENFRKGALDKYGLGYRQLKDDFPGLIYCSVTGFGHTGPDADKPGYDFLVQGRGGLMSITGAAGGEPLRVGVPISDVMTGMWSAVSVCAALRHREVTGEGQHIDVSLLDATVATLTNQGLNYLAGREVPDRIGNSHPNIVPYQVFETADGNIVIAVGNDRQWLRFCEFAGITDLATDERFAANEGRVRNREELVPKLAEIFKAQTSAYWLEGLDSINISCGPINRLDEVFEDPQVRARGMEIEMPHPGAGSAPVHLIGSPINMSESPVDYRHAPPLLGQHTDEILEELLDMDEAERARLRSEAVI